MHRLLKLRWPAASTKLCVTSMLGVSYLLSTPWGANHLVQLIEGVQPHMTDCADEVGRPLVLLGGGLDRDALNAFDFGSLSQDSTERMFGLLRTGLLDKKRMLLISGGAAEPHDIPESQVLQQLAISLGTPTERVKIEAQSTNTIENAAYTAKILQPQSRNIGLVTSALHMRRARAIFEAHGFDVCPVPVASIYVSTGEFRTFLPQSSALLKSESSIHELVGYAAFMVKQTRLDSPP